MTEGIPATQRYLQTSLKLQIELISVYRHIILLSGMPASAHSPTCGQSSVVSIQVRFDTSLSCRGVNNLTWNDQDFCIMLVLEVVSKRPVSVTLHLLFATLERRKELEPKCAPQLIVGSLLMTRRSAIGQFFPSPWKQSQKSLRKWTRPISLLVSKVANQYYINGNSSL